MTRSDESPARATRWVDAVAVVAVVVTALLAARALRPLAESGAFFLRTGETIQRLPQATWPRAVAWVLIAVAVGLRWRVVAAVGAWAAVVYEAVVAWQHLYGNPIYVMPADLAGWPLALAGIAAALLSVPGGSGIDRLGRRGRWLLGAAAAFTVGSAMAIPLLGDYYGHSPVDTVDPGFAIVFAVRTSTVAIVATVTAAGVALLTLATAAAVDRAVRPQVLVLVAAGLVGLAVAELGTLRQLHNDAIVLLSWPMEIAMLVVAPSLVLITGHLLTRRPGGHGPAV